MDVDRATAEELTRLPRIGPALAARIVAEREARGPFGSLEGLRRVSGMGPATLEGLRRHTAFSGIARPEASDGLAGAARGVARARRSDDGGGRGAPGGDESPLHLNRATAEELDGLPGIGPALAGAIVEDRSRHGPYRTVEDLTRVPGIGPKTVERLRGRVKVP
jgi:competence protein ComEA